MYWIISDPDGLRQVERIISITLTIHDQDTVESIDQSSRKDYSVAIKGLKSSFILV